jgi:hypothetical protein
MRGIPNMKNLRCRSRCTVVMQRELTEEEFVCQGKVGGKTGQRGITRREAEASRG